MSEHDPKPPTDDELIAQGIANLRERIAAGEWATLDDRTARIIASQFHGGQTSALYSFQSTGAIDHETVGFETMNAWQEAEDPSDHTKLDYLVQYFLRREKRGPVKGWHEATSW